MKNIYKHLPTSDLTAIQRILEHRLFTPHRETPNRPDQIVAVSTMLVPIDKELTNRLRLT